MTADDAYAKAVRTELDVKNMIVWLELEALKLGTDNQRERYSAGLLPEDELTALARTELFTGFAGLRRWAKRDHTALGEKLKHRISHAGAACLNNPDHPDLETTDAEELEADEWNTLKHIQAMADIVTRHHWLVRSHGSVQIKPSTHWATCKSCKAETSRSSAKVTIEWAGRLLTREYALAL